ncbi:hypothetical protein H4582DRAFT_1267548 [Lactarius indigo]|nr:hypothetical protein H4582DRAFT_1267548 [Lactarius indigo]
MPGLKLASTLAAAAYAVYFFGGEDGAHPPPLNLYLVFTLAAAVYVIGGYFFGGKNNDAPPPHDSYYSSPSYNSGTTRTQIRESYRPPPQPLSDTYHLYRPRTYAYSQTAPWNFTSPDHERGVYPSPYTRKPGQTRLIPSLFDTIEGEDLEFAKGQRENARWNGREMAKAYSWAKSAQRAGDHWAAEEHRQRGDAHKSEMEVRDSYAASIIFGENNKNRRDGMIDLHGLYVAEAIEFVDELLEYTRSRGDEVAYFIVGKGLHSGTGRAKIRSALKDLCNKRGLDHWLYPHNAGVLVVRLD